MIEVLKKMVEALEWCHGGEPIGTAEAIEAGKKAIKELESQEPVAWIDATPLYTYPPQCTEQEWDALAEKQLASIKRDMKATFEDAVVRATHKVMAEFEIQPTQRTWVGLTIEEIASCCRESTTTQLSFYTAIEAKLKEKNT